MEPLSPNDPLWKLLGKARPVEPRSNFLPNVLREVRNTPQQTSWWSRVSEDFSAWLAGLQRPALMAMAAFVMTACGNRNAKKAAEVQVVETETVAAEATACCAACPCEECKCGECKCAEGVCTCEKCVCEGCSCAKAAKCENCASCEDCKCPAEKCEECKCEDCKCADCCAETVVVEEADTAVAE